MQNSLRRFRFSLRKYAILSLIAVVFMFSVLSLFFFRNKEPIIIKETQLPIHIEPTPTITFAESKTMTATASPIPTPQKSSEIIIAKPKNKTEVIIDCFRKQWYNYKDKAMGHDYILPKSGSFRDDSKSGLIIFESLSTMAIMNLTEEIEEIIDFIYKEKLFKSDISSDFLISSVLGSLISSYEITKRKELLNYVQRILSLLPRMESVVYPPMHYKFDGSSYLYEITPIIESHKLGSIQIEFLYISEMEKNMIFAEKSLQFYRLLFSNSNEPGLISSSIIGYNGGSYNNVYSLQDDCSSIYDGLMKAIVFSNNSIPTGMFMLQDFIDRLNRDFFVRNGEKMILVNEYCEGYQKDIHIDSAYIASLLLDYSKVSKNSTIEAISYRVLDFFINYTNNGHKLPPLISKRGFDDKITTVDQKFMFCPYLFEALYKFWRHTNESKYCDIAWNLFLEINRTCSYNSIFTNVDYSLDDPFLDFVNPRLFSMTLKYLYLMFNDRINFNEWVFNSRGHPIPKWKYPIESLDKSAMNSIDPMFEPDEQYPFEG